MDFRAFIPHVHPIRPRVPEQRNPAPSDTIYMQVYQTFLNLCQMTGKGTVAKAVFQEFASILQMSRQSLLQSL
jgi:hypothetical protein